MRMSCCAAPLHFDKVYYLKKNANSISNFLQISYYGAWSYPALEKLFGEHENDFVTNVNTACDVVDDVGARQEVSVVKTQFVARSLEVL